jgi:hypothetical protein
VVTAATLLGSNGLVLKAKMLAGALYSRGFGSRHEPQGLEVNSISNRAPTLEFDFGSDLCKKGESPRDFLDLFRFDAITPRVMKSLITFIRPLIKH